MSPQRYVPHYVRVVVVLSDLDRDLKEWWVAHPDTRGKAFRAAMHAHLGIKNSRHVVSSAVGGGNVEQGLTRYGDEAIGDEVLGDARSTVETMSHGVGTKADDGTHEIESAERSTRFETILSRNREFS